MCGEKVDIILPVDVLNGASRAMAGLAMLGCAGRGVGPAALKRKTALDSSFL